jgi:hypothetical protein
MILYLIRLLLKKKNWYMKSTKPRKKKKKNYGAMRTILGMQTPEMLLKRILWSSLGGVSSITTSKEL